MEQEVSNFAETLSCVSIEVSITLGFDDRVTVTRPALQRFDLLISDLGMPDMNGYELIGRVRQLSDEHGGRIPAAALTAYAGINDGSVRWRPDTKCTFRSHSRPPI